MGYDAHLVVWIRRANIQSIIERNICLTCIVSNNILEELLEN